jgi:hypothetical protein
MSDVVRFSASVQSHESDTDQANLTPAQKEAQSAALKQPGRAILDGAGNYRVEQHAEVGREQHSSQDVLSNPLAHAVDQTGKRVHNITQADPRTTRVPVPTPNGYEHMPLNMAVAAGLYRYDEAGKLVAGFSQPQTPAGDSKSEEKQQTKSQDDAPLGWSSEPVDQIMSTLGREMSESQIEGLIATALRGEVELSDQRAHGIAQTMQNVNPATVKAAYSKAVSEAVAAANEIVVNAGVSDPTALYAHLEANDLPRLRDIQDSFARGEARPLERAAKEFLAKHGPTLSAGQERWLLDNADLARNGRIYRDEKTGILTVEIEGKRFSAKDAVRLGYIRVS